MAEQLTRTFAVQRAADSGDVSEIIITSESLDRDGDQVVARGGDWTGWKRTGKPVQFAHRTDQLPIAQGENLWIDAANQTHATFRWIVGDEFADRVRNVYQQGLLAASIGFIVDASEQLPSGGRRYTAWRGIEFSLTPTPSNTDAIAVTRALGLPVGDQDIVLRLDDPPARKSGRALSRVNEVKTRAAKAHCEQAATHLGDILASMPDVDDDLPALASVDADREKYVLVLADPLPDRAARHHTSYGDIAAAFDAAAKELIVPAVRASLRDVPRLVKDELARRRGRIID